MCDKAGHMSLLGTVCDNAVHVIMVDNVHSRLTMLRLIAALGHLLWSVTQC